MRRRRGAIGRATGIAESVASAVRRSRQDRAPRVVLYDADGHPRVLPVDAPEHADIVDAAVGLIALAGSRPGVAEPPEGPADGGRPGAEEPEDGADTARRP